MIAEFVGYGLSVAVLITIWLMGKNETRHLAYWLGLGSQLVWIWYVSALVYQPALLLMEVPLAFIYVRHIAKGD